MMPRHGVGHHNSKPRRIFGDSTTQSTRLLLAALAAVAMTVTACTSTVTGFGEAQPTSPTGSAHSTSSPTDGRSSASDTGPIPGTVQELWVLKQTVAIELDGVKNDVTDELVAQARQSVGDPVPVSERSSFRPSSELHPQLIDGDGRPVEDVVMHQGIFRSGSGAEHLAVLATPINGAWLPGMGYTLRLGLPTSAKILPGTPLTSTVLYAQYLPTEDATGLGDDVDPLALWHERAAAGSVAYVSDDDGNLQVLPGKLGVARHVGAADDAADDGDAADSGDGDGSGFRAPGAALAGNGLTANTTVTADGEITPAERLNRRVVQREIDTWWRAQSDEQKKDWKEKLKEKATEKVIEKAKEELKNRGAEDLANRQDIPEAAKPLIENIYQGVLETLTEGCRGAICAKDILDKVKEGAEESMKNIDDMLDYDDPDNPRRPDDGDLPDIDPTAPPNPTGPPAPNRTPPPTPTTAPTRPTPPTGTTPTTPPTTGTTPTTTCQGCDPPGGGSGGGGSGGGDGGSPGSSSRDPHMRTFDGTRYDFMPVGEFILATNGDLTIQARYVPVPCDCFATFGGAAVISDGEHRIEIRMNHKGDVIVDGETHNFTRQSEFAVGDLSVAGSTGRARITDAHGNEVALRYGHSSVNIYVTPAERDGSWAGLLGNANGDATDDFALRDGTPLAPRPSNDVISGDFADSWRITDKTSLFTYGPGESTDTFTNVTYPAPHPEASSDELEVGRLLRTLQARALCEAVIEDPDTRDECVFDYLITGNIMVARTAYLAEVILGVHNTAASPDQPPAAEYGDMSGLPAGFTFTETKRVATGDGLALIRGTVPGTNDDGDETDLSVLFAIDTDARSVRWISDPGVDYHTKPAVVDGVGVAVKAKADTALNDGEKDALLVLSGTDGSVISRTVADRQPRTNQFLAVGGIVALSSAHKHTLRGFEVDDDGLEEIWTAESTSPRAGPWQIGGYLITTVPQDGDNDSDDELWATIDPATGETISTVTVDAPGAIEGVSPLRDGLVAVKHRDGAKKAQNVVMLHVDDDGELTHRWRIDGNADDESSLSTYPEYVPDRFALVGETAVGWTQNSEIGGYSLDDGTLLWVYKASSFSNNGGAIAAADGKAFVGPFGGAWMEAVDSTGAGTVYDDPPARAWGELKGFTRIDDDTVLGIGNGSGEAPQYFAFLNG